MLKQHKAEHIQDTRLSHHSNDTHMAPKFPIYHTRMHFYPRSLQMLRHCIYNQSVFYGM